MEVNILKKDKKRKGLINAKMYSEIMNKLILLLNEYTLTPFEAKLILGRIYEIFDEVDYDLKKKLEKQIAGAKMPNKSYLG